MRFLRRSGSDESESSTAATGTTVSDGAPVSDGAAASDAEDGTSRTRSHTTSSKGRATPKRRDAESNRRRGPAPPPPRTQREASKLARQNRPSKDERRKAAADKRRRMDAGDDRVLLPRDRGPVRAYVRDIVDSRPHVIGLFLPLALLVVVASFTQATNPVVSQYVTLFTFMMLAVMIVEGTLLGIQVTRRARARFPDENIGGLSTGWYSFSRATQPRRMRVPKPKVKRGANVV